MQNVAPLRDVADALRKTTEVLARELASPTERAPAWTATEWKIAQATAAIHGVSGMLQGIARWRGPSDWQRFVDDQHAQTRDRHKRIVRLLAAVDAVGRDQGVAVTPLKGAALFRLGVYRPGERPMADVDLLVREADVNAASNLLVQLGYEESSVTWKHKVFVPRGARAAGAFGEHAGNPVKIDLHSRVAERLPVSAVDITDQILRARAEPGLNDYPSNASLMLHLLLHAAGNMRLRCLRMIQLHDIARVAARMSVDDWEAAIQDHAPWWALPPLFLTARYYPQSVPSDVLARLTRCCPRHLRRVCRKQVLTDVSLSNLWIEAFPGIEWSSTSMESVRLIAGRLRPGRSLLDAREELVQSHAWMAEDSWARLPQWRRVLRWVSTRQPRVETMHSVAAALGAAPAVAVE